MAPPGSTGIRPAIARSRVDLPDPLLPISPIASPRYAMKLTPLTACTSRMAADFVPVTIRLKLASGLPVPGVVRPTTRYTMWALSATMVGTRSATAVSLLAAPEVDVPDGEHHHGPDRPRGPQPRRRAGELHVLHQRVPHQLDVDEQRIRLDEAQLPAVQVLGEALHRIEHGRGVHP